MIYDYKRTLLISTVFLSSCALLFISNQLSVMSQYSRRLHYFDASLIPTELEEEICHTRALRHLSIGRKNAHGHGLLHPDEIAYPKLLCDGDAVSEEDMKPNIPANCLQSVIGDRIYDVIVLDFYEESNGDVEILVERLKKRFPEATIINLKAFEIGWAGYKNMDGNWVTISDWAENLGHSTFGQSSLESLSASSEPWEIYPFSKQESVYDETNKKHMIWYLYKEKHSFYSTLTYNEVKDLIIRRSDMYSDWHIFSPRGHEDVARGVMELTNYSNATRINYVVDWASNGNTDADYNCPLR